MEMQNRRVEIMSNGYVTLQGELKIDGGCSQDHFGSKPFSFPGVLMTSMCIFEPRSP